MSHVDRLIRGPEPKHPELPFGAYALPQDIIDGPRIPLRYGSAPTQICISKRTWRRTDGLPEHEYHYQNRWRSIDDPSEELCLIGKRAQIDVADFKGGKRTVTGVLVADEAGEGDVLLTGDNGLCLYPRREAITLIHDAQHFNAFERAILAHLGAD